MNLADQIIHGGPVDLDEIARLITAADLTALRDELIAGRKLTALLGELKVTALYTYGPTLSLRHTCPHWAVHIDQAMTLAELVRRADEHTEGCQ